MLLQLTEGFHNYISLTKRFLGNTISKCIAHFWITAILEIQNDKNL